MNISVFCGALFSASLSKVQLDFFHIVPAKSNIFQTNSVTVIL